MSAASTAMPAEGSEKPAGGMPAQTARGASLTLARLVRLALKELRETLRDRRTILTLVLMGRLENLVSNCRLVEPCALRLDITGFLVADTLGGYYDAIGTALTPTGDGRWRAVRVR